MSRVLIIEDEPLLADNIREKLETVGHDAHVVHTCRDALAQNAKLSPEVIILDVRLPDGDGLELLPKLKTESAPSHVIVTTAHGNERIAVEAMKAGAFDYLTKPIRLDELALIVGRAVNARRMIDNLSFIRTREEAESGLDQIIGESKSIEQIKKSIRRLAQTDALRLSNPPTVLITGETGTGKDLVARAIHYHGPRRDKPFIHVNCTALPESLFESELFGHLRGAFTSAANAKRGLFEVAEEGTLFLDEIGHLQPEMQAKLLHAIENREIRPVGGTDTRSINVHIIAATNRNLEQAVEADEFRRDLYHRLRVFEVALPPLRDRTADLPMLAAHFLDMHTRRFGVEPKVIADDALALMTTHAWPGNVRELSHLIENCLLQLEESTIDANNIPLRVDRRNREMRIESPDGLVTYLDFDGNCPTLEEVERSILLAAYRYTGRNMTGAARILGITREAFRYRLKRSEEATT